MSSELLFNAITGGHIPVANHPLFGEVWDKYANAYNGFVEELDLNDEQISKLRNLIDWKCAVERLGYYTALKIGFESSDADMKRAKLLFEYMAMEDSDQRRLFGFVEGLAQGKKKKQAI